MGRRAFLGIAMGLWAAAAMGEHDGPAYYAPAAPARAPKTVSTQSDVVSASAYARLQETLANTDAATLTALKGALEDIAAGRSPGGSAGILALDLLSSLPDDGPKAPSVAPLPPVSQAASPPPVQSPEPPAAPSVQVNVSGGGSGGSPLPVAAPSSDLFSEFPFETKPLEEADPRGSRNVKRPNATAEEAGAGATLPGGDGQWGEGSSGSTAAPEVGEAVYGGADSGVSASQQRLASVVSSFLGRFQGRATVGAKGREPASVGPAPGILGAVGMSLGDVTQKSVALEKSSPVFRAVRTVASEAGVGPAVALEGYYLVLIAAWVGTFLFVGYLLRRSPLVAWLRRRR